MNQALSVLSGFQPSKDILFTFLALCAFTILWVLFILWHLDLLRTKGPSTHKMLGSNKEDKDEEPPTFI